MEASNGCEVQIWVFKARVAGVLLAQHGEQIQLHWIFSPPYVISNAPFLLPVTLAHEALSVAERTDIQKCSASQAPGLWLVHAPAATATQVHNKVKEDSGSHEFP